MMTFKKTMFSIWGSYLLTAALCAALAYSASASTERMLTYTADMVYFYSGARAAPSSW